MVSRSSHNSAIAVVSALAFALTACAAPAPVRQSEAAPVASSAAPAPSQDASEASKTTTTVEQAAVPTGLVFIGGLKSQEMGANTIDPQTGQGINRYDYKVNQGTVIASPLAQAMSTSLGGILALRGNSDGTTTGGLVDSDGTFYPVTEALSEVGSFSGAKTTSQIMYVGDRIYFDLHSPDSERDSQIFSVLESKVAPSMSPNDYRKEVPVEGSSGFFRVAPDGSITRRSSGCEVAYGKWANNPSAFFDETSYLSIRGTALYKLPLSAGRCSYSTAGGTRLTPGTSRRILSAVVSPDRSSIAFVAQLGQVKKLYTMPADGGDPKEIADVSEWNQSLVEWR